MRSVAQRLRSSSVAGHVHGEQIASGGPLLDVDEARVNTARGEELSRKRAAAGAKHDHSAAADALDEARESSEPSPVPQPQTECVNGQAGAAARRGSSTTTTQPACCSGLVSRSSLVEDSQRPQLTLSIGEAQRLKQPRKPSRKGAGTKPLPQPSNANAPTLRSDSNICADLYQTLSARAKNHAHSNDAERDHQSSQSLGIESLHHSRGHVAAEDGPADTHSAAGRSTSP
jgi:hypothetical protein